MLPLWTISLSLCAVKPLVQTEKIRFQPLFSRRYLQTAIVIVLYFNFFVGGFALCLLFNFYAIFISEFSIVTMIFWQLSVVKILFWRAFQFILNCAKFNFLQGASPPILCSIFTQYLFQFSIVKMIFLAVVTGEKFVQESLPMLL